MSSTDLNMGRGPMSAKELTDRAKQFDWNPRIGFKYWARAAETIHHEGQIYLREGNFPQAYLVLFRYSTLVLEYLVMHPEAKEPESRKAIKPLQKRIPQVIAILETLRPAIDNIHDQWRKTTAAPRGTPRKQDLAKHPTNDSPLSWNYASSANILDVQDHQDLAVDLAKKEIQRRRRAAGALEEGKHRLSGARQAPPPYMDDDELRRQMEATRRQLDRADGRATAFDDEEYSRPSTYYYPSISKSSSLDYERPTPQERPDGPRPQPPRPPKERHVDRRPSGPPPRPDKDLYLERDSPMLPPPRPGKEQLPSSAFADYSSLREQAPALPPKAPAEPAKQERVSFRPAATLENSEPLRPVFLPSGLRQKFLAIAADNTRKGLEMCGMLCGTTVNNALFISHLVIPEQKCTSDTCDTENESGMLEYCITNDLIVIGWIHTHPTQTCFMSSRDLHTQAGYQVMMPESIAIVCAPHSEPSWGIFRLTNPPGLPHILACQRTETFHPHAVDNLYVEAGQPPGHVYESRTLPFEVCDLRPGH